MKSVDFETFCSDPQLVGEPISKPWATFYKAVEGLPLDEEGIEIFRACTGQDTYEPRPYVEATAICGRRSEKTSTGIKFAIFKALTGGYESMIRRGELLRVPIIAQDLRLSRDIKRSAEAMLKNSPVLSNEVDEILAGEIRLRNGLAFSCYPCTHRSTRGLASPVALADEIAFWAVEGASDTEVVKAIRPAQIQFGQARRLVKFSTPWAKSGLLYEEFSQRSDQEDILVWQASTEFMTPRISRQALEKERRSDPSYYQREYEAMFVDDLETFLPYSDIEAAIKKGYKELPPQDSLKGRYYAALDASSLTGRDRFCFGIAHTQVVGPKGDGPIVDMLRGWKKASVPFVCDEIASLCKSYSITAVTADQFAAEFLGELMRQRGISLNKMPFTGKSKPEIFLGLKRTLAEGGAILLDHPESLRELRQLEAKKLSGGGYQISAPRGAHDDYATVIALLAHSAGKARGKWVDAVIVSDGGHEIDEHGHIWRTLT